MQELVGKCKSCGKDIYCLDGFLNGIHNDDQHLICFDCEKKEES
jgi:hypothetical protein